MDSAYDAKTHRSEMAHWRSGSSIALRQQWDHLAKLMMTHAGPVKAALRSFALIQKSFDNQAQLFAYVDVFRYLALACALRVPIAFVLKRAQSKHGAEAA
jgi:DHA2 family multidrug resistance protein